MMKTSEKRGSILIWTLLLGLSLASVFFFFAQRLNQNAAAQRETIQYQNAKRLLDSYGDYLGELSEGGLILLRDANAGAIEFAGMTGTLANQSDELFGTLDSDESVIYEVSGGAAKVEWNYCDGTVTGEDFDMTVSNSLPSAEQGCTTFDFKDVTQTNNDTDFELTAGLIPVTYRVTPTGSAVVSGPTWQLSLNMSLGPKETVTLSRSWTP